MMPKYYALLNDDVVLERFLRVIFQGEEIQIGKRTKVNLKDSKSTIMKYRSMKLPSHEIASRLGISRTQYYEVLKALDIPTKSRKM